MGNKSWGWEYTDPKKGREWVKERGEQAIRGIININLCHPKQEKPPHV